MYLGGIATHKKKQSLVRSTFYHMLSFGYCCCNFFTCIQNTSLQHYLALACFRAVLGQGKKEENFRIAVKSQKLTLWEMILVYLSWYSTTPTYVSYIQCIKSSRVLSRELCFWPTRPKTLYYLSKHHIPYKSRFDKKCKVVGCSVSSQKSFGT